MKHIFFIFFGLNQQSKALVEEYKFSYSKKEYLCDALLENPVSLDWSIKEKTKYSKICFFPESLIVYKEQL